MADLIEHKRSKRELDSRIATPFRKALFAGNYVVAWSGKMGTRHGQRSIAMHIIGTDLRALCGIRRPIGEVSNMTEYSVTDQTCRKCLQRFCAETGFAPDDYSDHIDGPRTPLSVLRPSDSKETP